MERSLSPANLFSGLASLALAAFVGLCACAAAMAFGEPTKKKLIFVAGALVLGLMILVTRRPRPILLFIWTFFLPYNRMYYSFDRVFGDHGPQGFYWIPTDLILVALLGLWVYERVVVKHAAPPAGPRLARWLIPFAVVCLLSGLAAERASWTLFEMARLGKFALILLFVRYNFGWLEWWACLAALGCSTIVQSGLAMMQLALKSTAGVLGLLGGGGDAALQEVGAAALGGWIRGVGTIGHPSNLACYLLMPIPVFIALALTAVRREHRLICGLVALVGFAGLGWTLSRWPCALMLAQILLLLVALVVAGQVPARRVIGLAGVGAFAAGVVLFAFQDVIYERLTRDLRESLDFRAKDRRIAFQIFESSPLLGVGLNNYAVHLLKYDPEIRWAIENADEVRWTLRVRTFVALHNYYLFALAETGVLGLGALILFYSRVVQLGLRSVRSTTGPWKGASLGLLVGILGVYGQGFIDFSFWVDPILYTFALISGMLVIAPALSDTSVSPHGATVSSAFVAGGGNRG